MSSDDHLLTAAEVLLARLKARGIDYIFANGGTDFAPIIEGLARGAAHGVEIPEALTIPHETAAVGMAHGYYLMTGRPQAVMVHVNVGLANAVMGLINAGCEAIPMMMLSGRTPVSEYGLTGSRSLPIHWGQDMRDQNGLVREAVKWDYELRAPAQTADMVDRAYAIAMSAPRGPVYMSLPREVLCAPAGDAPPSDKAVQTPAATPAPNAEAIAEAARLLTHAERPLIIAQRGPASAEGFDTLSDFAERHAMPVVEFWPARNSLSTAHPMHAGFGVDPWLGEADVVLVLDALVPWIPDRVTLAAGCTVIQAGPDPLFTRTPVRAFPTDLALAGGITGVLNALGAAMPVDAADDGRIEARRARIIKRIEDARQSRAAAINGGAGAPMSKAWVSHCLSRALPGGAAVFNELGCDPSVMSFTRPGAFFGHPLSGGLGWGLTAALGAQLADRDRLVVAAIGDGSYQFANPVSCHQIAEALELPLLTIVFNNQIWNAVRLATLAIYDNGYAARANTMPVTSLAPSPDYTKIVEASRGVGIRVESGDALPDALTRAIDIIRGERRQVLLDVNVGV